MAGMEKELELVRSVLKASPRGLTVSDVALKLDLSRNSAAKYLEVLLMAGQVEMRTYGRARIFSLSHRVSVRTALSLSSDMFVFVDENLQIVEANDQFLKFTEISREEALGQSIEKTTLPILLHRDVLLNIRETLHGREFVREISVRKGGADHYFRTKLIPVVSQAGERRAAIMFENITEHKKAELALMESEANFRRTFDESPIGACMLSLDFRTLRVNAELCRISGYSEDELLKVTFPEITHPRDRDEDIRLSRELIEGKIDHYDLDKRYVRKDGRIVWVRKHVRLIYDSSGKPHYFLPLIEDITDMKNAMQSLKLTQFSVDRAVDAITWSSPNGRILYANDSACRLTGYSREDLIGMYDWEIDQTYDKDRWPVFWDLIKRRGHLQFESVEYARDGRQIPVEISANYLQFDNNEYICAFIRDISQRKEIEEELRLHQSRLEYVNRDLEKKVEERNAELTKSYNLTRAILDTVPTGVLVVEADTLAISYISPDLARFLGSDVTGTRMGPVLGSLTLLNPDGSLVEEEDIPALRSIRSGETLIDTELILQIKDEYQLYIRMNSAPVKDPDGRIVAAVATMTNMTAWKATERRLTETMKLLQAALHASPLAIGAIDPDGNVILWNRAAERIFGYDAQEVLGRPLPIAGPNLDGLLARLRAIVKSGETTSGDLVRRYRKDGAPVDVRVFISPLTDEGGEMIGGLAVYDVIRQYGPPAADKP